MSEVEVDKMFRFYTISGSPNGIKLKPRTVCDKAAKVAANDTVPSCTFPGVKLEAVNHCECSREGCVFTSFFIYMAISYTTPLSNTPRVKGV